MSSSSGQPQFRYSQTPSKVLHLRNLPWECTEEELVELGKPFGKIVNTKSNVGANRNQAFVEFVALDKAIEEQLSRFPPYTPMIDITEAAFRSTFGEEYNGRCRGMGTGVTAIQIFLKLSRRTPPTGMRQRKSNESEEIAKLKSQMTTMQTTMDFLVDAISRQSCRDDRFGTSGEPGIHLYPDQFVRMMSLIREKSSNNETTSNDTPQTNHSTRANFGEGKRHDV